MLHNKKSALIYTIEIGSLSDLIQVNIMFVNKHKNKIKKYNNNKEKRRGHTVCPLNLCCVGSFLPQNQHT